MVTDEQIKEIINLTAFIDERDGSVWGKDTEVYEDYNELIKDIREIINENGK